MSRPRLNPRDVRDEIARKKLNLMVVEQSATSITTTSATLGADDHFVLVDDDTAGGAVTITLPAAADSEGYVYQIKKLGTTGNVVVDGNSSETIDGGLTATLTVQFESITIYCDGSNWHIL